MRMLKKVIRSGRARYMGREAYDPSCECSDLNPFPVGHFNHADFEAGWEQQKNKELLRADKTEED